MNAALAATLRATEALSGVDAAILHYDGLRAHGAREHDAREAAALYLRRKCAGALDAEGAAVALADALARRAAATPQPGD